MTKWLLGLLFVTGTAFGLDGEKLYTAKLCNTCHGMVKAKPTATLYPSLFGKDINCMQKEYDLIKTGKRGGMAVSMKAMIGSVKDEEAKTILAFVAKQAPISGVTEPASTKCKPKKAKK